MVRLRQYIHTDIHAFINGQKVINIMKKNKTRRGRWGMQETLATLYMIVRKGLSDKVTREQRL